MDAIIKSEIKESIVDDKSNINISSGLDIRNSEDTKPLIKSSDEILSELFSTFNAEPPTIEANYDKKKKKKSKKKHKKKHKRKSRKRSDEDTSCASDGEDENKKRKHKKKKRKKHDNSSSDESKSTECSDPEDARQIIKRIKAIKTEKKPLLDISVVFGALSDGLKSEIKLEKDIVIPDAANENNFLPTSDNINGEEKYSDMGSKTPPPKPVVDVNDKNKNDKVKSNKIQIKNLKYSSVFEATVKEAEEQARKKAERYEDGELSATDVSKSPEHYNDFDLNSTDEESKLRKKDPENSKVCKEESSEKEVKKRKHGHNDKNDKSKYKHREKEEAKDKDSHRSKNRYKDSDSRHRHSDDVHSRSYNQRSVKDRLGYHSTRMRSRNSDYKQDRRDDVYRSRSRHRSRSGSRSRFDKKKLLEIARKNAIHMLKNGTLPGAVGLGPQAQEKVLAAIKAGGKTIDELTDFCKNLSKKEALGELSSVSSNDEMDSTSDTERPFNHPFQIKERPTSIVMNIPNSTVIPIKTPQEKKMDQTQLRMQFPVSSGQHHRKTESEWVPVSPKKETQSKPLSKPETVKSTTLSTVGTTESSPVTSQTILPPPGPQVMPPLPPENPQQQILGPTSTEAVDIGSVVSQRLAAMRKLQENPNDVQAIGEMYRAQQEMQSWATSKQQLGQFTGSTGVQILTPAELSSGYQAWARKDQFRNAAPVSGGMGMRLLQKMGWQPGEGLGKEKNGALQPLVLDIKLDKMGLTANEEIKGNRRNQKMGNKPVPVKTLQGKHPVSLLGEYAAKRKAGIPQYELCFECGPDHQKNFLFKVKLNGMEYKPSVASPNKKQAKADAATVCLQAMGVLPS